MTTTAREDSARMAPACMVIGAGSHGDACHFARSRGPHHNLAEAVCTHPAMATHPFRASPVFGGAYDPPVAPTLLAARSAGSACGPSGALYEPEWPQREAGWEGDYV
ncbi:MAG: hypothetical protein JNM13_15610 [Hyphomicrobiaceae bacterium]|nr:hypothetical protein [Hyphomicrobiaceae bacterium]